MVLKPKILFIVDRPLWAYHYMVMTWEELIRKEYDCYVCYQEDYLLRKLDNYKPYSIKNKYIYNLISIIRLYTSKLIRKRKPVYFIHNSCRYSYPVYPINEVFDMKNNEKVSMKNFDYIVNMAFYFPYTAKIPFIGKKNLIGIFTDSFPHEGPTMDIKNNIDRTKLNIEEFYTQYLKKYNSIIVGGGSLYNRYIKFTNKIHFVYGIYGQTNFIENNAVGEKEELIIGWTGSPKREMKGFENIIMPAIDNVCKTGRKVKLKTKFSGEYSELYDFYKNIDLIVIASSADSGPSLFAEAALSNVPCISTKVGLPLTVIKDGINGMFISRDIKSLEEAIIKLYDNRELLKKFSVNIKKDYLQIMDNRVTVNYFLQALKD